MTPFWSQVTLLSMITVVGVGCMITIHRNGKRLRHPGFDFEAGYFDALVRLWAANQRVRDLEEKLPTPAEAAVLAAARQWATLPPWSGNPEVGDPREDAHEELLGACEELAQPRIPAQRGPSDDPWQGDPNA